jgi:hypothetical protein
MLQWDMDMVGQMTPHDQVVAKYNPEQNEVEVFDLRGTRFENSDMVCLANMLNDVVDEMVRRGYDPETIVFSMGNAWGTSENTRH